MHHHFTQTDFLVLLSYALAIACDLIYTPKFITISECNAIKISWVKKLFISCYQNHLLILSFLISLQMWTVNLNS